jgi:endonuclease YncB( thermonuclease family)
MNKNQYLKRLILFLFVLLLGITLSACKDDEGSNNGDNPPITVEELTTEYTDGFKLASDYEGKNFLSHGIGRVELIRVVDGDTAHFSPPGGYGTIKIRMLGINTPESTIRLMPWGKHASAFVAQKLGNAYEIVLEAEEVGKPPVFDTTGDRYLGYVWYRPSEDADLRLLNLEVIEQCFSYFTGGDTSKYYEVFELAFNQAYATKLRVFGQQDPDFNYDTEVVSVTIASLRNHFSNYSTGVTMKIKAQVIRKVGSSMYIEDLEETVDEDTGLSSKAGIYLYHSFTSGLDVIKVGDIIEFNCQATESAEYGTQLVNPHKVKLRGEGPAITIREVDPDVESLEQYEGYVVKVPEFTVEYVGKAAENGAYTIRGTMKNGVEIQVRVDGDATPKLDRSFITVGKKYDVIGGVSKYVNPYEDNKVYYQIKLGNITSDTMNDFVLSENQ